MISEILISLYTLKFDWEHFLYLIWKHFHENSGFFIRHQHNFISSVLKGLPPLKCYPLARVGTRVLTVNIYLFLCTLIWLNRFYDQLCEQNILYLIGLSSNYGGCVHELTSPPPPILTCISLLLSFSFK